MPAEDSTAEVILVRLEELRQTPVHGEVELPHLAGDAGPEEVRALEAELRRAWHPELCAALDCDEDELCKMLEGRP